jgi:hypothetical protein
LLRSQYAPQLLLTCRHRGSGSLSITSYAFQVVGGALLFVEQLGARDPWPVWAPMLLSTSLQGVVTILCVGFDAAAWVRRRRVGERQVVAASAAEAAPLGAQTIMGAGSEPLLSGAGAR